MARPSLPGLAVRFGGAVAFLVVAAFVAHAQVPPTDEGPPAETGFPIDTSPGETGGGGTGHTGVTDTSDTGVTDTGDTGGPPPPDPDPPSSVPLPGGGTLNLEIDAVAATAPNAALVEATLFLDADAVPTRSVVFTIDISTSALVVGAGCGGDFNADGLSDTVLDCELFSTLTAVQDLGAWGTVGEVSVVVFFTLGAATDVQPLSGRQVFTAPFADLNFDGVLDIETVLRSVGRTGFFTTGARLFTSTSVSFGSFGGTNFSAAAAASCGTLGSAAFPDRTILLLSDGEGTIGSPVSTVLPCAEPVTIQTVAVGPGSGCHLDPNGLGSLADLAALGGGTCTQITDPGELARVLGGEVIPEILRVTMSVNGGLPVDVSDSVVPVLPHAGGGFLQFSRQVGGLTGDDEICLTAYASDPPSGTEVSVTECTSTRTNGPPVADAGPEVVVDEGDLAALDGSGSSDPDTDPLTYRWEIESSSGPPLVIPGAILPATTVQTLDDGFYTFRLTVSDGEFESSDTVTVDVRNVAPTATGRLDGAAAGGVALLTASFTDPGILDSHTVSVDWGDGTVELVTVSAQGTGWGSFYASHTYATSGSFLVVATITDDDGGSSEVTLPPTLEISRPVAIWATSTVGNAIDWTGGSGTVNGLVHSNAGIRATGSSKSLLGGTEYATTQSLGINVVASPAAVQVSAAPSPILYVLADYRPGGRGAVESGADFHDMSSSCGANGRWQVSSALAPGLYFASCDVKLLSPQSTVTIVADGEIQVTSQGTNLRPFVDGLLFGSTRTGRAVLVSSQGGTYLGHVFAPNGTVDLSGSGNRYLCGIVANKVDLTGSGLDLSASDCVRPDHTTAPPTLVPVLSTALVNDPSDPLPSQLVTSTVTVSNDSAVLLVPGVVGLQNHGTTPVTITAATLELEVLEVGATTWTPFPAPTTLSLSSNTAAGVTYGAGFVGTVLQGGALASWGAELQANVPSDTLAFLLDLAQVVSVRASVSFTVDDPTAPVRPLYRFGDDVAPDLRSAGGTVTDLAITLTTIDGATTVHFPGVDLAPGDLVAVADDASAPAAAPIDSGEIAAAYLARLATLDGAGLGSLASVRSIGGVGLVLGPQVLAHATLHAPIVSAEFQIGSSALPGSTLPVDVDVANTSTVAASNVMASVMLAGGTPVLLGVPPDLASGALSGGSTAVSVPASLAGLQVDADTEWSWTDAAGGVYGPVRGREDVQVETLPEISATLTDTLVDADGDGVPSPGDTLRYTATVTDTGSVPISGVQITNPLDPNLAYVVGSATTSQGTIASEDDAAVVVDLGTLLGHGTATVIFEATIDDPFPSGVAVVSVQGTVSATSLPATLTDDPAAPGTQDRTTTAVRTTAPVLDAMLFDQLTVDADLDGGPSAGDTLQYVVILSNPGLSGATSVRFQISPDLRNELVVGSVFSDRGTVVLGNGPGDTTVEIDLGTVDGLDAAFVMFDVIPRAGPGVILSAQGSVTAVGFGPATTDDPETPALGDATLTVLGGTVNGPDAPAVTLVSPAPGSRVGAPSDVVATAEPATGRTVASWEVVVYPGGDPSLATTLAAGVGALPTVLVRFDPTLLQNGLWTVDVSVTDDFGRVGTAEAALEVAGAMKLGAYDVAFMDAEWHASIFQVSLLRSYTTLRKDAVGDFGKGWELSMIDFTVQRNGPLGQDGWRQESCGGGLVFVPICTVTDRPHLVLVRWPDGHVEAFDFTPAPTNSFFASITGAAYTPRPGATSTLAPYAGDETVVVIGDDLYQDLAGQEPYDPKRFWLTDNTGLKYLLDRDEGLVETVDRNDNHVRFGPDGIFPDRGIGVTFLRDGVGRIEQMLLQDGSSLTYGYDAAGDLTEVVDPVGDEVTFTYDDHRLVAYQDAGHAAFAELAYDADGRLISQVDPLGVLVTTSSDPFGYTETVVGPDPALTTTTTFDVDGLVTEVVAAFDGQTRTVSFEYDARFLPVVLHGPAGEQTLVSWDADGRPLQITDPDGTVTAYTYNATGDVLSTSVDGELQQTLNWDAKGNMIEALSPTGTVLRSMTHDATGAVTDWIDADGVSGALDLDADGLVTGMSAGLQSVSFGLDAFGRVISATDALGATQTTELDARGEQISYTDALGRTRRWEYDARGFLVSELDSAGRAKTYTYDDTGRITREVSRTGTVVDYEYDTAGRLVSVTGPDASVVYDYDPLGRVVQIDNEHTVVTFEYDLAGDLVRTRSTPQLPGAGPDVELTYTWSPGGRLLSVDSDFGRIDYGYDGQGRPNSLTDLWTGSYAWIWRADGLLDAVQRPDGLRTELDYSPGQRAIGLATTTDVGALLQEDQLLRDSNGRITSLVDVSGAHEYSYDVKGQLVSAQHPPGSGLSDETYAYDAMGNRTSWTGHPAAEIVYDGEGRLVQDADELTVYDAEGRQIQTTDRLTSEITTYTWNAFDELVRVGHPDATETTYSYDGLGRRIEVVHAGDVTRFGYDGADLRMVFDGSNTLVSWQTTDPWGDLLADYDPLTDQTRDALLGYLGTLEGWVDAQGVETVARDSFGNPALPSAGIEPHALSWHAQDPNGLIYAGARYLDPGTGRFLSQDPAAAGNQYNYALNDPIHVWDPFGAAAAIEDNKIRSTTGAAVTGGARRTGIKLVCTFNEVASIVALTGPEAVLIEVVGVGCAAVGSRRPGRPRAACPLCLTGDTEVGVPEGARGISELEVGDRVLSDEPLSASDWERVTSGSAVSAPPAAPLEELRYESRTGAWVPPTGPPEAGDEVLRGGRLWWYGESGLVDVGPASRAALQAADVTWDEAPRHGTPDLDTWVLVLDGEPRHARLRDVAPGTAVAFQGRVLDTIGAGEVSAVRGTGRVLARVVRTFSRLAPEVIEATVGFADGTTETLTGTPEHPFHLADEGRYAPLREVDPGARLTTRDGTEAVLLAKQWHYGDFEVFNFEVEGQHNYFAGLGDVLVHNAKRCKSPSEALRACRRQQQPRGIDRIDKPKILGDQWHAHLLVGGQESALNLDGSWRHFDGPCPPVVPRRILDWLIEAGWQVPK